MWGPPSPKSCWCLDKDLQQINPCRTDASSSSAAPPIPSLSLSFLQPTKLGWAGLAATQHCGTARKRASSGAGTEPARMPEYQGWQHEGYWHWDRRAFPGHRAWHGFCLLLACLHGSGFLMNSLPACASCLPAPAADLPVPAAGLPALPASPPALAACWHLLPAPARTHFCPHCCLPTHPAPACAACCLHPCLPAPLPACSSASPFTLTCLPGLLHPQVGTVRGAGRTRQVWPPRQLVFPPPRALPAEARVAPLPAPLGTCYSWQRQLENGRQRRNFVCSGLGSGQTSGLQLSGARNRPPVPRYGPGTRGTAPAPGQASACPGEEAAPSPPVC